MRRHAFGALLGGRAGAMLGATMIAQALVEKGMLDSLASGFSGAASSIQTSVQDHPYLWAALVLLVLFLLLRTGSRR